MSIATRITLVCGVALAVFASPALAAGTLTVGISGAGTVTAPGIDCVRDIGDKEPSGDCSQRFLDGNPCDFRLCLPEPAIVLLTASTKADGFEFSGWTDACERQRGDTCRLEMTDDFKTTAVFADVQAPALTFPALPGPVRGAVVVLTATATDNAHVTRVDFALGGKIVSDTVAPFSATFNTTPMPDGKTVAVATAFDAASNATASEISVTIDNTLPTLTVSGPNGASFAPGSAQEWGLIAGDAGSGVKSVQCSVVAAGAPAVFGACSGPGAKHVVTGRPAGSYVFTARVTDNAGNVLDVARTFTIDATAPVTSILSGIADGGSTSEVSLTWGLGASEPGVAFSCRVYPAALTPGAFAPCSGLASHIASGFAPGVYAFEVRGVDAAGNIEAAAVKRTFTVVPAPAPASAAAAVTPPARGSGASGQSAARSPGVEPQIVVTLAFNFTDSTKKRTKLASLVVKGVPAGSTVTALCPKSCGKKGFKKTRASGDVSLKSLIKKPLKAGSTITVTVSKPGMSSAVKILKILPRKSPKVTTKCQPAGASRPGPC